MIDIDNTRKTIKIGLENYLFCKVIRGNQTSKLPKYPYLSYNFTTIANTNKGTYGELEDGTLCKPFVATMSITAHSDKYTEALMLANKAREWLDCIGNVYLSDNDVIVQSVGSVSDRSNLISMEYEYTFGFDCFLWLYDIVKNAIENEGVIESVSLTQGKYIEKQDTEKVISELQNEIAQNQIDFKEIKTAIESKGISISDTTPTSDYAEAIEQISGGIVDTDLNSESTNAVQNKIITAALTEKQNRLIAGDNVEIAKDVISVLTTDEADEDNTKPITSAGVNKIVGNIDALLGTI